MRNLLCAILLLSCLNLCLSSDNVTETTSENTEATSSALFTTTISPEEACRQANDSCEDCVKNAKCYYCLATSQCTYYPADHIFPKGTDCGMGDIRWGKCWLNFKALVISLAVIGGVVLISLTICCYCCCCRTNKKKIAATLIKENAKREREREERRIRNLERQKERETKHDEIRRKYGLIKDDRPYQRFDA